MSDLTEYNLTEHTPNPAIMDDDWNRLVRIKDYFIILSDEILKTVEDKSEARIGVIALEQTIDDMIAPQEKRLIEFFHDDRQLPITNIYREYILQTSFKPKEEI